MPELRTDYPHVEQELGAWLTADTGRRVYTTTPPTLEEHLPAYKAVVVGGRDGRSIDRAPLVEVEAFASTRSGAWDAARDADRSLRRLAASGTSNWYVDDVECVFQPAVDDYENPDVVKITATYALTVRPIRA
ncbi:hypothetical protein [Zhihengliuella halotolerans]|uniref:Tail terminator n=1 Tax=Zhihengliuella halotolerans TaxID=370736 RepID=A0A4Q8AC24_9MICC|nr:hypothetical protein [Zhihengliuella halotolerans]RZU61740.1 hypothetical protein EV380_1318 [Zhihengliuella halotolerans]